VRKERTKTADTTLQNTDDSDLLNTFLPGCALPAVARNAAYVDLSHFQGWLF
jgi:hypothetical protein